MGNLLKVKLQNHLGPSSIQDNKNLLGKAYNLQTLLLNMNQKDKHLWERVGNLFLTGVYNLWALLTGVYNLWVLYHSNLTMTLNQVVNVVYHLGSFSLQQSYP